MAKSKPNFEESLRRLEQIVVLKFLGVPLKQVRGLLEHESNLARTLEKQQVVLGEKQRQVEKAIRAIGNALRSVRSKKEPDWKLFQLIVREIEMQNRIEWKGKYFSEEAKARVMERRKQLGTEVQERANAEWTSLYAEAELLLKEDKTRVFLLPILIAYELAPNDFSRVPREQSDATLWPRSTGFRASSGAAPAKA